MLGLHTPQTPVLQIVDAARPKGENFWRLTAEYCFIERPDIPGLLRELPRWYIGRSASNFGRGNIGEWGGLDLFRIIS